MTQQKNNIINFFSLNTRGLGATAKRMAIFLWLKAKGAGIYFLQETHSACSTESKWKNEWDGKIFFSHGEANARGVAILVSKHLQFDIHSEIKDSSGRFLLLDCTVCDKKFILVNLYAPTIDKKIEQSNFGNFIILQMESYIGQNIMIAGDLNISLDSLVYKTSSVPCYTDHLLHLQQMLDIIDIWRILNPDKLRYTRRQQSRSGFSQSRLDYFLISCHLQFQVKDADILPSIKSDHSLLKLQLNIIDEPPRGKGVWKLNSSLLLQPDYIQLITETIESAKRDALNLTDKSLSWDFIKCRVRTESISYAIREKKKNTVKENELHDKLAELEEIVSNTPSIDILEEITVIKTQLEDIFLEKAQGTLIRSRCKHVLEHEKPSKYFLNLERANNNRKNIKSLKVNGEKTCDPEKILDAQKKFFFNLYTEPQNTFNDLCSDTYMGKLDLPQISKSSRQNCEKAITLSEIETAIKSLPLNKTPGPDGLPIEFYKKFSNNISEVILDSFIDSFRSGLLTVSQRQGIICLIPKKGKDLTDLKSWRPLSILNTDYKILAKVLANRLKVSLTEIINPDQVGYMQDRFCGENTRLIADIIDFSIIHKHPCIILLADFEKAFDSIRWKFLKDCLKFFGFGPNFQKWISTLYNNTESCVTNNGHQSKYFKLSRGIRQGCPLSALLFLLPAEVIATVIRGAEKVKGISLSNIHLKLCQLADDMTLSLSSVQSVKYALNLFEEFYRYAGLKLNMKKTEAFIVYNNGTIAVNNDLGISWINKPFKALGIWFALNQEEMLSLNIGDKIDRIKTILNMWQGRALSLMGKITILKSLVLPQILQLAYVFPLHESLLKDLENLFFDFVWNKGKHLVSKQTLFQNYAMGGFKMLSIIDMVKCAKIMWVKRFCNSINANWKFLSEYLMGISREKLLCKTMFKTIEHKPKTNFYSNLLHIWFNFITADPKSYNELLSEYLCFIMI